MADLLNQLKAIATLQETETGAGAGDLHIRILDRDRAELSLPDARCEIGIERGSDEDGRPGWYIYPEDTDAWDDGSPLSPEERFEVARLLTAALSSMGYQVWADA